MECMSRLVQLLNGSSGDPLRGHYQMRECAPIILLDNISSPLSNWAQTIYVNIYILFEVMRETTPFTVNKDGCMYI